MGGRGKKKMFCTRRALQLSPKTVTMETQPCRAHSATMLLFTTNERCIAPKKTKQKNNDKGVTLSPVLRTGGYVTSMAIVFSDRLFSAGLSCS